MRNALAASLAAAVPIILVLGCASTPTPSPDADPGRMPAVVEAAEPDAAIRSETIPPEVIQATRMTPVAGVDRQLQALLADVENRADRALAAYQAGDHDGARSQFETCLDLVLDSGYDLAVTPELRTAFYGVVDRMNGTDLTFLPEPSPTTESWEEAADEVLAEVDPNQKRRTGRAARGKQRPITYDIPMVENEAVLRWIELYQTELRDRFEEGLRNSGRFLPMIYQVFEEEGLPRDLVHLAQVESSYKARAYSRARAMGIWQFIQSTGRMYGLHRDDWVDDRANPEKATRAAARHLKDLYAEFDDWYLAMAAYNGGPGRVRSAIRRTGSRDFWVLRNSRYLRRETKNYVPAILATIRITKDPAAFGFDVEPAPEWQFERSRVESMTDLRVVAKCAGVELQAIKDLNPELRWLTTPPSKGTFDIRLPVGTRDTFEAAYAELPHDERVLWVRHRVRRGETLSTIAGRYGTTIRSIQGANGIRNRHKIRQGTVLMIPVGPHAGVTTASSSPRSKYTPGQKVRHRVRRGESLSTIARRYRTDVDSLCAWNKISPHSVIYAGERITVYYDRRAHEAAPETVQGRDGTRLQKVEYRVRRGDTLTAIASRFRTSLTSLCQWNGISRRTTIFPGDTLIIYQKN